MTFSLSRIFHFLLTFEAARRKGRVSRVGHSQSTDHGRWFAFCGTHTTINRSSPRTVFKFIFWELVAESGGGSVIPLRPLR